MSNECTKSECSKKYKKIGAKVTASAKKEIREAKEYGKLWNNYSKINDHVSESTKDLNSVNLIIRKKLQKIDALKQIKEERQEELNKVKDEIKELKEKIKVLHQNQLGSEKTKSPLEKLLKMSLLKNCTRTYISDKAPHLIRGFTANTERSEIIPFEIDPGQKTKDEIEKIVWENCLRSSEHAKQWEQLFNLSLE
ncbi:uncharacterized protein PF3D7_1120000 isoform X1 [Episyrphus balteatus]|uniref:uncharacterized protein PF3D7_1120000 isoform X1 n=1 Tax=Episyrphus balteatus TaxID=286459 RepID=UPI0024853822|nr:uncharacterized protein PF3D7_1120000 isoform X1 [Episyrphus balteatus]